jgi:solute carrier family 25 phosphate transporter 23/24/25/41
VEKGLHELQNQHHARVESLWAKLGPSASGELDLKGLQKGFRKMDHRKDLFFSSSSPLRIPPRIAYLDTDGFFQTALKNADSMLRQIMNQVDTNGDGKIQYEGTLSIVSGAGCLLIPSYSYSY